MMRSTTALMMISLTMLLACVVKVLQPPLEHTGRSRKLLSWANDEEATPTWKFHRCANRDWDDYYPLVKIKHEDVHNIHQGRIVRFHFKNGVIDEIVLMYRKIGFRHDFCIERMRIDPLVDLDHYAGIGQIGFKWCDLKDVDPEDIEKLERCARSLQCPENFANLVLELRTSHKTSKSQEDITCNRLYLGNLTAGWNINRWDQSGRNPGISTIINMWHRNIYKDDFENPSSVEIIYEHSRGDDGKMKYDEFKKTFGKLGTQLYQALSKPNNNVLVHAEFGISRSATIIICMLIKFKGMTPKEALKVLRDARPVVHPDKWWKLIWQYYRECNPNAMVNPMEEEMRW